MKQIFISILLAGSLAAGTIIAQNTAKTKQIFKNGAVEFSISVAEIDSVIFTQVETNNAVMHIMRDNVAVFQSAVADIDSIVYYLPEIPVESIELSNTSLFLIAGETYTLTAAVLSENAADKTVTWTSDNENVATVDVNGKVTAVAEGMVIITVKAGEQTATCTISIKNTTDGVRINGIIWATRNLDYPGTFAENPESAGRFYKLGTIDGRSLHSPATGNLGWIPTSSHRAWARATDPCPAGWRVPTGEEITNLRNQPSTWTTVNGVNGRLFGTVPNQIFLPAAGWRNPNGILNSVGTTGAYWSNPQEAIGTHALTLSFGNTAGTNILNTDRRSCRNVRCVADSIITNVTSISLHKVTLSLYIGDEETLTAAVLPHYATNRNVMWRSSDTDIATVDANGRVTAVSVGTATITAQTADGGFEASCKITVYGDQYRYSDIGVEIAGITWATRNVDAPGTFAPTPESSGMFYQWNRRVGWSSANPMINSDGGTTWDSSTPEGTAWYSQNDPCPQGWRVPTQQELQSLNNAGSTWVSNWNDTGINGRLFGTAPNQIFLPVTGQRSTIGVLNHVGTTGRYWSSSQVSTNANAWTLSLVSGSSSVSATGRRNGFSVRCVAE